MCIDRDPKQGEFENITYYNCIEDLVEISNL